MSSSSLLPCERIGKYRLLAHVATGGMGTVYKARDEMLNRTVALKVLSPELASNEVLLERFRREAQNASRLQHKNIVSLFECGEANGLYFLAMEYIDGIDLSEYIRRRDKIEHEEARRMMMQACKALDHAFNQGIVHRDIKPSNFLLANEDGRCRVKLTDLGLSRNDSQEDFRVTRAGTTVGTVDYMAPEQARDSAQADIRSDIYSLGCTLYQMLAGHPPFPDGGLGERVYRHMAVEPPDIRKYAPDVPAGLWTILRRMLAKHPDDRFQTPAELYEALRSLHADAPDAAPVAPSQQASKPATRQVTPVNPRDKPLREPAPREQAPSSLEVTLSAPSPAESPAYPGVASPTSPPVQPVVAPRARDRQPQNRTAPQARTRLVEGSTVSDPSPTLPITPEQRQAAAGQFQRALEVQAGGDLNYALQLLQSSCKLDPLTTLYRKILREVGRQVAGQRKGRWLGSFTTMGLRGKVKAARRAGDHRKVLELGEDVLTHSPDDVATHLDLAASAEELNCSQLAVWLLEQARRDAPENITLLKALAGLQERLKNFGQAIALWEIVRKTAPDDTEAPGKIKDLSATDTIARSTYRR